MMRCMGEKTQGIAISACYKRREMIQYNFDDEQNDRIGVLLGSINNLRDVWGESRKYRRRTLISNDISQRQIILVFIEIENSGFTQKILRDKNKNT